MVSLSLSLPLFNVIVVQISTDGSMDCRRKKDQLFIRLSRLQADMAKTGTILHIFLQVRSHSPQALS